MTHVVLENCIKCKYMDCVEVCPVDCFYEGENMLVIHPDECIDCGACEPECPWEAIFEDEATPDVFKEDVQLNANMVDVADDFKVPEHEEGPQPTPEQVGENKKKWEQENVFFLI